MILTIKDDFNLDKIAKSGQCFRWRPLKDGFWKIPYRVRLTTGRSAAGSMRKRILTYMPPLSTAGASASSARTPGKY